MDLQVIEHENQRVLTTAQVASAYEVESKSLMRNYQRNKEQFVEGVHFMSLTGEALKQFKGERQNDANLKFTSLLYLWTEQGAFMLAKSISSDKGWSAYKALVTNYYKTSNAMRQQTTVLPYDEQRFLALEERVKEIEAQLQLVTIHSGEQKRLQKAISERVYELCDVKARRPAYFSELYRAIKKRYHVDSYRDVPQCQLQDTLLFVQNWGGIQTT